MTRRIALGFLIVVLTVLCGCSSGPKLEYGGRTYTLKHEEDGIYFFQSGAREISVDKSGTDGFTLVVEGETYRITESEDRLRIAYPSGKVILGRWNGDELAGVESSTSSAIVAQDVELLGLAFQANGLNGEEETKRSSEILPVLLLAGIGLACLMAPALRACIGLGRRRRKEKSIIQAVGFLLLALAFLKLIWG